MRPSPTKLLHGLLYTTPILLLTLVACGGGGGGTSSGTVAAAYTLGGYVSGLNGSNLTLRNSGGDDLTVASGVSNFTFTTSVLASAKYNVTVQHNPDTPTQLCSVTNPSGTMPAFNLPASGVGYSNVMITCQNAYTIGGAISGLTSDGLVLQNNGGDNVQAASGVSSYVFNTPLLDGDGYKVTILKQPSTQTCTLADSPDAASSVVATRNMATDINCVNTPPTPALDRFAFVANNGDSTVQSFKITSASGVPVIANSKNTESSPTAVAADAASHFIYVTNSGPADINVYSVDSTSGTLTPVDADSSISGPQNSIKTGPFPIAIVLHPSGKFAYVVNHGNTSAADANSVSGYSVDPVSGALARIDTNAGTVGTQYYIKAYTQVAPLAMAITPNGKFAYVTSSAGSVIAYSIDTSSGALTYVGQVTVGGSSDPIYGVAIDPTGSYVYVIDGGSLINTLSSYSIDATTGALTSTSNSAVTGNGPRAVTIDPSGKFIYVANGGGNDIAAFTLDGSGGFSQISCGGGALCNTSPYANNFLTGAGPISIHIESTGSHVYVASSGALASGGDTVWTYSIDSSTGALTNQTDNPGTGQTTTGASPYSVTTSP